MDFQTKIKNFVKTFSKDGWILKESNGKTYATNERRVLPVEINDETVFVTYYIDVDEVFQAPVLSAYFYTESGHRLTYDELLKIMPEKLDMNSVSERIHPITGIPLFFIHPCKTIEYITPIEHHGIDFMNAWIGVYGPLFLYRLPI
ncbi:hypothetical protein TVAG_457890 [Trichomonas vaginalis G3]|uniref:Uncharacterized protein n=1 Tax=Trichomonas vaginalis (strain ATCC PRA-98 / G3) TaxID=412133 RepID=A2F7M9_TRIV3|nr:autophagy ACT C domain family [Trichomonas vaginalis G3]EAX99098.1 hypothetical protein TVAG_457890 [Trichomonas vaginalis G3]KAI5484299.1 autophagy ACT C domain family [Trichomonas vaginalis G3]|eukprot:XP_001312028.1 hypothetical protein [Trichomonas vaginalis G3]